MRLSTALLMSCLLSLFVPAPAAHAAPPPAARWPATRAGELARGWVTAFAAGEDSMRTYLSQNMAAASLAERSIGVRLERYREMREQYGRFQLESVVKAEPAELSVKLLDGQAKSYDATFAFESQAPWKLKGVTLRTRVAGHSMFGGFHH